MHGERKTSHHYTNDISKVRFNDPYAADSIR